MRKPERRLTGPELIEAARSLTPLLRESAAENDRTRHVPAETFEAFQKAGLMHTFKPAKYGGFEMGLFEHATIAMELSRGCGSSGWIFSLLNEHNWFISLFPEAAQDEIWGQDSYNCSAASIRADPSRAKAERVEGGYVVSGKFPFASGSDQATWLLLAAVVSSDQSDPNPGDYTFLLPKESVTPIDDWYTLGMRGTQSHSWEAREVFVPEHRAVKTEDLRMARTEGARVHSHWKLLQSPRAFISPFVASSPTLGVAIGAVDTFTDLARDARRRFNRIAESQAVQLKLAESSAEVDAGRLMIESDCLEMMKHVNAGIPVPPSLHVRTRRDSAYVGLLAHRAVERLHTAIGSRGVFDGHPLERAVRDVHTGIAQVGLHWEIAGTPYAQFMIEGITDEGVQLNQ